VGNFRQILAFDNFVAPSFCLRATLAGNMKFFGVSLLLRLALVLSNAERQKRVFFNTSTGLPPRHF